MNYAYFPVGLKAIVLLEVYIKPWKVESCEIVFGFFGLCKAIYEYWMHSL